MMVDKILIVNKPKGITSHDVVDLVRKKYNIKKVGHAGTLDPMAQGVLLVLLGNYTKRQSEFMGLEKEYVAEIAFGIETDTYDAEGSVQLSNDKSTTVLLTKEKLEQILKIFVGEINQKVPVYSAVKIGGKPLYWYARKGLLNKVTVPVKKVNIKQIELLDFAASRNVLISSMSVILPVIKIKVTCDSGVYIRSLAHDIGDKLGTGAVLVSLVRTRVGKYKLEDAVAV